MTSRILLFGRDGQLGHALYSCLPQVGKVQAYDRMELDLTDLARLRRTILDVKPDVVVNAAAYTAVDQAESETETATTLNAIVPGVMAEATRATGSLLVHYSTDYVFDGNARTPYTEEDAAQPLNVYGKTKLEGERAIATVGGRYLIIRTAWLYSWRGRNFLKTILRLAQERGSLRVVDDQTGSPSYAPTVAEATVQMLTRFLTAPDASKTGVFHLACNGTTTWYKFTLKIMELYNKIKVNIDPISTADYPTPARRPAYSALDTTKLARLYGIHMPHWEEALTRCMAAHGQQL